MPNQPLSEALAPLIKARPLELRPQELAPYVLRRYRPTRQVLRLLAMWPILAAIYLVAKPGPVTEWPTPHELWQAMNDVHPLWLAVLALSATIVLLTTFVRVRGVGTRELAKLDTLHCTTSPLGRRSIERYPSPRSTATPTPLRGPADAVLVICDTELFEALALTALMFYAPVQFSLVYLAAVTPVMCDRTAVLTQLLNGLHYRGKLNLRERLLKVSQGLTAREAVR